MLRSSRKNEIQREGAPDSRSQRSKPLFACPSTASNVKAWGDDFSLMRIARTVSRPEETLGVLVHGSFATGKQAPGSDIDLICVTKTGDVERQVQHAEGLEVDTISGCRRSLETKICSQLSNNNNSILYAFVRGRPLIDGDGSLAGLIYTARQIWSQGPIPVAKDELDRIKAATQSALSEAARLTIRATRSAEWHEIASLRSSMLFVDSVHNFCRVHELWASAIWELLRWCDPRYRFLQRVIWDYFGAPSLANRIRAIQDLGEAVLSRMSEPDDLK